MSKEYKRRNFFINKRYQGRFMFQFYLLLAVAVLLFSLVLTYLTADSLTIVYQNNDLMVGRTPLLFVRQLLKTSWFLLIPFGVVVLLLALFQTHRTAGPLFKFEKVVTDMLAGHLGQTVYLREKDEGKELATKLTLLNKKLAQSMAHLQELSRQLGEVINQKNTAELQLKEQVRALTMEIDRTVGAYTIADGD